MANKKDLEKLQTIINVRDNEIKDLKRDLKCKCKLIDDLSGQLIEAKDRLKVVNARIDEVVEDNASLDNDLFSYQKENLLLKQILAPLVKLLSEA